MPRWEIAGRALIAGWVTGGLLGAVLGGVAGVVVGMAVGMVLCLPGMLVAVVLYPVMVERHGHADARAGTAAAVSVVTGVCLVVVGGAALLVFVLPVAFAATMLGLRQGCWSGPVRRATRWMRYPFVAMLAGGAGLIGAVVAAGACAVLSLLRDEAGWPRAPQALDLE